jgi:hypothetical protein
MMAGSPGDRRQVPAYVALARIVAVVGMSATIAFGIFLLIAAVWVPGLVSLGLALPFFALMRLAERTAEGSKAPPPD